MAGDPVLEETKLSGIQWSKGKELAMSSDLHGSETDEEQEEIEELAMSSDLHGSEVYMSPEVYWALVAQDGERLQRIINELPRAVEQITRTTNQTALHVAAMYGHKEVVQKVLIMGSPSLLTTVDSKGYSPLHVAAKYGRAQIVSILINPAKSIMSPAATSDGESEELVMKRMLGMKVSIRGSKERLTAIDLAAMYGHLEVVKVFTREREDLLWAKEAFPLLHAAKHLHWDVVYYILSFEKAKKHSLTNVARGPSPLLKALVTGSEDVALKLMKMVPEYARCVDMTRRPPLHLASYLGLIKAVRKLLKLDSSAAYIRDQGRFPIHLAAIGGHIQVYEELIQYCPDLEIAVEKIEKQTVLHLAVRHNRLRFVHYILETTKSEELINATDFRGNTALHLAIIGDLIWHAFLLLDDERIYMYYRNDDGKFPASIIMSKMQSEWGTPFSQKAAIYSAVMEASRWSELNPDLLSTSLSNRQRSIPGQEVGKKWRSTANNLLVAATLIATISFASIFTLPGQYHSSGSDQGLAHFRRKTLLKFFILVDALALFSSIVTAILVIVAAWTDTLGLLFVVPFALKMAALSFIAMCAAFVLALILMINRVSWELILVSSIGFIIVVILLLIFLGVTSPARAYWRVYVVLRKILMLPQRVIGRAILEFSRKGIRRKWKIVRRFGKTINVFFKAKWRKHPSQR